MNENYDDVWKEAEAIKDALCDAMIKHYADKGVSDDDPMNVKPAVLGTAYSAAILLRSVYLHCEKPTTPDELVAHFTKIVFLMLNDLSTDDGKNGEEN